MQFPRNFIAASDKPCDFKNPVPAPYIRKRFTLCDKPTSAQITICGLGFYTLYINGRRISPPLAPYINSTDDFTYYNQYEIASHLTSGENVIGIVLGNGLQNPFGGYNWHFHKASWLGVPKVALELTASLPDGTNFALESDTSFKTSPSPIYFDELRAGERYDAQDEQPGWNLPGFNDNHWANAIKTTTPKGEPRICIAEPIAVAREITPVSITPIENGYLYDFGVNTAGVCRLRIKGAWPGQRVSFIHGEVLREGRLDTTNIAYGPDHIQEETYIVKGYGEEEYTPMFTYHGFQYVYITGIIPPQATEDLLTYLEMYSDLQERGGFNSSSEVLNTLQTLTRRSTLSNFYYFPTDCPQREKNGWTGDAAISAEHTLLNLAPEKSYREWLNNVRKAQLANGKLPGIVPTAGWGYDGIGPAWDCVITELPYFTYVYRGDTEILQENATAIFRYLHFLNRKMQTQNGLIKEGLGDWCQPTYMWDAYTTPVLFTDSVISMDIANKAAFMFDALGWEQEKDYAQKLSATLRKNIREKLIDLKAMEANDKTQTAQAMALYYGIFNEDEKQQAFQQLLNLINEKDGHMDTGILGARVIFHVLSDFGHSQLAYDIITKPTYPSYAYWLKQGATALWEEFNPDGGRISSRNHHFFGDISGWFIKRIAGIRFNPTGRDLCRVDFTPSFISDLDFAEGFHEAPAGKIVSRWEREGENVRLEITLPPGCKGEIRLENGWVFESGQSVQEISSGKINLLTRSKD